MTAPAKTRLDVLLMERGLAASRERARALILAGRVLVNEQKVDKPGVTVALDSAIRLLGGDLPYVSRGGIKLAGALDYWKIKVMDRACLDVGASTGGFTDCLLQRGATHVTAVDTGFGQIAMKLRNDSRVRLMERTNARLLSAGALAGYGPELTLLVMDVSFISATLLSTRAARGAGVARSRGPGEAAVRSWPRTRGQRRHCPGSCSPSTGHRSRGGEISLGGVGSDWDHSFSNHGRRRQSRIPSLRTKLITLQYPLSIDPLHWDLMDRVSQFVASRRKKSWPGFCRSWWRGCVSADMIPFSIASRDITRRLPKWSTARNCRHYPRN